MKVERSSNTPLGRKNDKNVVSGPILGGWGRKRRVVRARVRKEHGRVGKGRGDEREERVTTGRGATQQR